MSHQRECGGAGWFTQQLVVGDPYGICPFCDQRVPCDNRGRAIRHLEAAS